MGVLQPHGPEPAASLVSMLLQQGTSLKHTVSACCLPALCQVLECSGEGDKALAVSQRGTHPRQGQARAAGAEVVGPGGGSQPGGLGGSERASRDSFQGKRARGRESVCENAPQPCPGSLGGCRSAILRDTDVGRGSGPSTPQLPPLAAHPRPPASP